MESLTRREFGVASAAVAATVGGAGQKLTSCEQMGRRVRLARQSEGLAIADCAGASGLSVAEWCALEAGNDNAWHELGGEELVRGAELLGVTVDWIIFGNAA